MPSRYSPEVAHLRYFLNQLPHCNPPHYKPPAVHLYSGVTCGMKLSDEHYTNVIASCEILAANLVV